MDLWHNDNGINNNKLVYMFRGTYYKSRHLNKGVQWKPNQLKRANIDLIYQTFSRWMVLRKHKHVNNLYNSSTLEYHRRFILIMYLSTPGDRNATSIGTVSRILIYTWRIYEIRQKLSQCPRGWSSCDVPMIMTSHAREEMGPFQLLSILFSADFWLLFDSVI